MRVHKPSLRVRSGFTLLEALVATSIAAIAGSALLLGVGAAVDTTQTTLEQTIAMGMAEQIMDEIAGQRYAAGTDPYESTLGPSSTELAGNGRERFNDIDDYNGFRAQPAQDVFGRRLGDDDGQGGLRHAQFRAGSYFANWRQEIDVFYVRANDLTQRLPAGQTSDFRAVVVRILVDEGTAGVRELVNLRRVFAYVPPA